METLYRKHMNMIENLTGHTVSSFTYMGQELGVSFVETVAVNDGVECDVYTFNEYLATDLAIIRVEPGKSTPIQRILAGCRTVEGHLSGGGQLTIVRTGGEKEVYTVNDQIEEPFSVDVNVGDLMQWQAAEDSSLVVYEICYPPYEDGRFEDLDGWSQVESV